MKRKWLIRTTDKMINGPYDYEEVLQIVKEGHLAQNDEICSGNGFWFHLHESALLTKYLYKKEGQPFNPVTEADDVLTQDSTVESIYEEFQDSDTSEAAKKVQQNDELLEEDEEDDITLVGNLSELENLNSEVAVEKADVADDKEEQEPETVDNVEDEIDAVEEDSGANIGVLELDFESLEKNDSNEEEASPNEEEPAANNTDEDVEKSEKKDELSPLDIQANASKSNDDSDEGDDVRYPDDTDLSYPDPNAKENIAVETKRKSDPGGSFDKLRNDGPQINMKNSETKNNSFENRLIVGLIVIALLLIVLILLKHYGVIVTKSNNPLESVFPSAHAQEVSLKKKQ